MGLGFGGSLGGGVWSVWWWSPVCLGFVGMDLAVVAVVMAAVLWVSFFFFFFFLVYEIDFWFGCDCDCGGSGGGFGCGRGWVWWLAMVGVWCLIVLMFRLIFVLH